MQFRELPRHAYLLIAAIGLLQWPASAQAIRRGKSRRLGHPSEEMWLKSFPEVFFEEPQDGDACNNVGTVLAPCGEHLVCRHGLCSHCELDEECPVGSCIRSGHAAGICQPQLHVWSRVLTEPYELICTVLIFLCATLAASAGTGGGGMFVPLLLIFSSLKDELAVPLSQSMIFCSSLINVLYFASQRHPVFHTSAKIDYDCVVLLEPMLCLGVTLGVLVHQFSPPWLNILLLCATLGSALWRTAKKGCKQRREEKALCVAKDEDRIPREGSKPLQPSDSWDLQGWGSWFMDYRAELMELVSTNSGQVRGIVSVWIVVLVASFHGIPVHSVKYGAYVSFLALVLAGCTATIGTHVIAGSNLPLDTAGGSPSKHATATTPIQWVGDKSLMSCVRFPVVAFAAGLLGGSLGLGGGIIISPVLLEVGMHSEAVQATTAAFVFLSSSLATIQYVILGQVVWDFALWYGVLAVVATALGQHLCEVYVRRHQQYSAITLSIAGVLLFSLLSLVFVGVRDSMGVSWRGGSV